MRRWFALHLLLAGSLSCGSLKLSAQSGSVSEQYLLAAANQDRLAHGLKPLRIDVLLCAAALFHARQMAGRGMISHQFSGEADLATRAAKAGAHFSLVTENVAEASNSALIHELWMKSAGHRANLLDAQVDAVGIAVVAEHGQLYAVEDFARTVERMDLAEQEAAIGKLLANAGLSLLEETADARQTCQLAAGYVAARQPGFVMRFTATDLSRLPEQLTQKLASRRYSKAVVGACLTSRPTPFSSYSIAVMLYP